MYHRDSQLPSVCQPASPSPQCAQAAWSAPSDRRPQQTSQHGGRETCRYFYRVANIKYILCQKYTYYYTFCDDQTILWSPSTLISTCCQKIWFAAEWRKKVLKNGSFLKMCSDKYENYFHPVLGWISRRWTALRKIIFKNLRFVESCVVLWEIGICMCHDANELFVCLIVSVADGGSIPVVIEVRWRTLPRGPLWLAHQ